MSWNHETNYSSSASSMAQKELSLSSLRHTATWIREDLDTLVAREGPDALGVNDVLALHSVFVALQSRPISIDKMRFSRIHLAVQEICGRATRWPARLVEEADRVVETLESRMGSLRSVRTPLYEQGGRLYGICQPNDITHDVSGLIPPTSIFKKADFDIRLLSDDSASRTQATSTTNVLTTMALRTLGLASGGSTESSLSEMASSIARVPREASRTTRMARMPLS